VEIYETNDGMLVISSDPVRSENAAELLEKTAVVCANMYKKFAESQSEMKKPQAAVDTVAQLPEKKAKPKKEKPAPKPMPERSVKNGLTLGYIVGGEAVFQVGFAQARPIGEEMASFVWEANVWAGADGGNTVFGVNLPILFQFDLSVFSFEAGAQFDALYINNSGGLYNVGAVVGGGLSFGGDMVRPFYRFNYGTGYYSHLVGIRKLF